MKKPMAMGITCLTLLAVALVTFSILSPTTTRFGVETAVGGEPSHPDSAAFQNISWYYDVSDWGTKASEPVVVTDRFNSTHVVWVEEFTPGGNRVLKYRKFNYTLQAWEPVVNLTTAVNDNFEPDAVIAPLGGNDYVFIVWTEDTGGISTQNVKFAGKSVHQPSGLMYWNFSYVTTGSTVIDKNPSIVVVTQNGPEPDQVQVIWEMRYNFHYVVQGRNDTIANIVTNLAFNPWSFSPAAYTIYDQGSENVAHVHAAVNGTGDIFIVFRNDDTNAIYTLNNSKNPTWAPQNEAFLVTATGNNKNPRIAINQVTGREHVVWLRQSGVQYDLLALNKSFDAFWDDTNPVRLAGATPNHDCTYPSAILDDSGNFYVTWGLYDGTYYHAQYSVNYGAVNDLTLPNDASSDVLQAPVNVALLHGTNVVFAWMDGVAYGYNTTAADVLVRELDRNPSWFIVMHPAPTPGETRVTGNLNFEVHADVEARVVSYFYRPLGNPTWTFIGSNSSVGPDPDGVWTYSWDTSGLGGGLGLPNFSVLVNVTDVNGLNQTWSLDDLMVDNSPPTPAQVYITNVSDTLGHFNDGTAGGDLYFGGNVTVGFHAADAISGVKSVTLYNDSGANVLASKKVDPLSSGAGAPEVWGTFTFNTGDFNLTNVFIRAYDYFGLYTSSTSLTGSLRIDHNLPQPYFANLVNGTEISQVFQVTVGTYDADPDVTRVMLYNGSSPVGPWTYVGEDDDPSNGLTVSYDSRGYVELSAMFFRAVVEDITGYQNATLAWAKIDNKAPDLVLVSVSPSQYLEPSYLVGLSPKLTLTSDNDTVKLEIYNRSVTGLYSLMETLTTANFTFPGGGIAQIEYVWSTKGLTDDYIYLMFKAFDNNGLNDTLEASFILESVRPCSPEELVAVRDPVTGTVTLTWDPCPDPHITYVVYRLLWEVEPTELTEHVSQDQGDFIYRFLENYAIKVGEVPQGTTTIQDHPTDPHEYFYFVIGNFTAVGNLGNVHVVVSVEVPPVQPGSKPDLSFAWRTVGYGAVALLVLVSIPAVGISRAKKTSREDLLTTVMDEKVKRTFVDESFGFDSELRELDRAVDESLGVEVKVSADESDFLSETVDVEETPAPVDLSTPLIDRELGRTPTKKKVRKVAPGGLCPECGWMLSATATKCPRCGFVVEEEVDE
ncbi:MAG: hypothetical protein Kow0069_10910 [Promethearchaeota archaeon]